jgi:hypothetical protein
MIRIGTIFGPKIAAFVYPIDPDTLPEGQRANMVEQATTARLSLVRAGWDVFVLPPQGRLADRWHANSRKLPAVTG